MNTPDRHRNIVRKPAINNSIFDPRSREFIENPAPMWELLTRNYPIVWHSDLRMWLINSHDLCSAVLKSPSFTTNWNAWEFAPRVEDATHGSDFERLMSESLHSISDDRHRRLRRLTMPAFSRNVMTRIEDSIRGVISDVYDEIGYPDEFDIFPTIAEKLPVKSIAKLVGVPPESQSLFENGLAFNIVKATRTFLSPEERQQAGKKAATGFALLRSLIEDRRLRKDPGDDFLGKLVSAGSDGDKLSDWDIMILLCALIGPGSETAVELHTYAFLSLLRHPDQYELLLAKPELMKNAVHEILRFSGTFKLSMLRYANEDTILGGELVQKGQGCIANLSAAWNDAAKWPNPRVFDITRPQDGSIVFGTGPHFCIGIFLSFVQVAESIRQFHRRFPRATLSGSIQYDYEHHMARRISSLRVHTNIRD